VLIYARFADNRYNELTRENGVTVGVNATYAASIALASAPSGAASYYAKLLPALSGSGGDDVLTATWTDPCTAGVVIQVGWCRLTLCNPRSKRLELSD